MRPSRQSLRGLDWLNFFIANVQTGFGPFVSVYLTAEAWTQVDIGLVLTVSGIISLAGQVPAGVMVDAMRSKRFAAVLAAAAIAGSALALAVWPIFPIVLLAEVLHGLASCFMSPAIAAISLGLVTEHAASERFGRNARFASVGNGIAAALMGACGRLLSNRAVFFFAAALAIPALIALGRIKSREIDPVRARGGVPEPHPHEPMAKLHGIADNRPLLVFAACLVLFNLGNGAMLPLMGSLLTMRSGAWAAVLIAACIVVPQVIVALFSPWVGRQAELIGRRRLLLIGFAALPIRGILFIVIANPYLLVAAQLLDGISAAVLGVMTPLVVADVTRGTGRFNAALGVAGTAAGIGASISTTVAGYATDAFGSGIAFLSLAALAALGFLLAFLLMPETMDGAEEYS